MAEIVNLTADVVKDIHQEVLNIHGGLDGLRDEGLLISAISAAQATWGGEPLFKEPIEAAAAYLFYLCKNHPFNDGNKRTALAACLIVSRANGLISSTQLPRERLVDWEHLTLDVASGKIDRDETAKRLRNLLQR